MTKIPHNKIVFTENEEEQIKKMLNDGSYAREVLDILNLNCEENVLRRRYNKEVKCGREARKVKIYKEIIELYKTEKRFYKIRKNLKVKDKKILEALSWGGVDRVNVIKERLFERKFAANEGYFNKIDNYEKAYYLGLLYADGNITKKDRRYGVTIGLKKSDSYILKNLNDAIRYGREMYEYVYKCGRGENEIIFSIRSRPLTLDLINLGCYPKKSLTLEFPKETYFREKYMGAFLRGYFDGDGSASFTKRLSLRLCCSKPFARTLIEYLSQKLDIKSYFVDRGKFADVSIPNKVGQIKFYKFIYKDQDFPVHLKRKKKKIEMLFDTIDEIEKNGRRNLNKKEIKIKQLGRTKL